ncbi:MAG: phosphoglycerate dehydrogenase [Syntrophaceae bacterium CG2_30_49_12]|nr:MAG: phosphoglycerate dehydrogenase [Syntrophaceae bacterium CG2_30_49_12]PIP05950.1 MAG: phosphoglycerate dehydrogenase [Syntrophobacterales bacterium CG23_combo_of_CG06-09_8_20_14_all_48_27]PJC73061.1 MAG: phosphoglycerate dehydrogenase [Syntrophobacterales bacterium CG_4_8_14_3_um_filter_49_14]
MKRVLVTDNIAAEGVEIFKKMPGIEVDVMLNLTPDKLKKVIKDYDGLTIRSATKVTREIIDHAERLSVIGRAGTGLDNVDVAAATKRGIVVMNTPGGNTVTAGEHAVAMMLSLARKIPQATASMKAGRWEKSKFIGTEFCNKTLGIIGIGRIGSIVADRAQGLKMNIIAYDPFISPETAEKTGVTLVAMDELLSSSDFISVHPPLTKETRGIVNADAFVKMKRGVFIVNCARGGIVNERDLYDALISGKVAGAALDVFEEEPTKNRELLALDNVICTPHLGASTDEAQTNVAVAVAEQIAAYLTRGEIKNAVNFPSVSAELLNVIQPYLILAEKLGKFESQLVSGGIREVIVEYNGEILNYNTAPITISLLKGLLTPILNETVNYINAPLVAKERGIKVVETKSSEVKDYTSMITLTIETSQEVSCAAGTIFGRQDPRIVRINKFTLEVVPEGHMLVLCTCDRPGVIGNIGATLGDNLVNIARLHFSREQADQQSLVVLSTDGMVSDDVLNKLRGLPHVISVTPLEM